MKAGNDIMRSNSAGQGLLVATLALLGLGVVMVNSALASLAQRGDWYKRVDVRNTLFAIVAAIVLLTLWRVDYRRLARGRLVPIVPAVLLALACIAAVLVFVPGIGHKVGDYSRWIRIGPEQYSIGFQPSELVKLSLVIFLAAWLTRDGVDIRRGKTLLITVVIIGGCVGLVVTQDLSTAIIICATAGITLFLAGARLWHLAGVALPAVAAGYFFVLHSPARLARITAFLDPWSLTNPRAYQPRQSLLAVISGGWTGRGLGNGIMTLGFVPEDSTDFIFSVFCEEWGFVGAVLLMGLVALWIFHARRAAVGSVNPFGRLLAGSLGFLVAFQAVMHIAVDLVVVPPTGMSFPFLSAGGTALVLMAAAVAMMVSVTAHPEPVLGATSEPE